MRAGRSISAAAPVCRWRSARAARRHIHDIPRAVPALGGYVERPDGTIRGLIDAGAVAWLDQRLAPKIFARFFAGRGILIPGSLRSA